MCILWMSLIKWQCAAIYHVAERSMASKRLHVFCWVPVPTLHRCLGKPSHPSPHRRKAKRGIFISTISIFWANFRTYFWWIMSCQQRSTRSDNVLAPGNQVWCPSKELRGLNIYQYSHVYPLFASSGQAINENVYNLNTAKQVTMRDDLSCYWILSCFLNPSFILLGASSKFRCLTKLSHPSLLSKQAKTVIFISKITIL